VKKILIVDDEILNRDVLSKVLKKECMLIGEAANGKEAIDLLSKKRFDLILMDLNMPIMDGFEAIHIIRDELKLRTPIITISAINDDENIEKAKLLGANDYLTKPYNLVTMVKVVKKNLT